MSDSISGFNGAVVSPYYYLESDIQEIILTACARLVIAQYRNMYRNDA